MALTPGGTPYVESSDLVANYPAVSLALAEHIDGLGSGVLQVVSSSLATAVTSSSSTWADTGLTATITPTSASNKILVVVHQNGVRKDNNTAVGLQLLRGASVIAVIALTAAQDGASGFQEVGTASISFEDTPATISATTYKTQFRSHNNIATASLQRNDCVSTITLMEIAA